MVMYTCLAQPRVFLLFIIDLGFWLLKVKLFLLPIVVGSDLHADLYAGDRGKSTGFAYLHSYAREQKGM